MSASKTFTRYASQWFDLFDKFVEKDTEDIVVTCDSQVQAIAFRLEYYKARAAFMNDGLAMVDNPIAYKAAVNNRQALVRGSTVVFAAHNNTWAGQLIASAFSKEKENENQASGQKPHDSDS